MKLTSKTDFTSSSVVERRGFICATPAFATIRVKGPSFETVSWIREVTSSEEVTSATTPMARGEVVLVSVPVGFGRQWRLLISVTRVDMSGEAEGMSFMQTL